MSHHNEILQREILLLSNSQNWLEARSEWALIDVEHRSLIEGRQCLCSYTPISELCHLQNKVNYNEAIVGNVCVKNILGLNSDKVFNGIRRIKKDIDKALNPDASLLFFQKGLITRWEYNFSIDTFRKRDLSSRQIAKRHQINNRVLGSVARGRLS